MTTTAPMTSATRGVGMVSLRGGVVVDMLFERSSGSPGSMVRT